MSAETSCFDPFVQWLARCMNVVGRKIQGRRNDHGFCSKCCEGCFLAVITACFGFDAGCVLATQKNYPSLKAPLSGGRFRAGYELIPEARKD